MVEKIVINLRNNFIRILRKMWIKIAVEIFKNKSMKNTVKNGRKISVKNLSKISDVRICQKIGKI